MKSENFVIADFLADFRANPVSLLNHVDGFWYIYCSGFHTPWLYECHSEKCPGSNGM